MQDAMRSTPTFPFQPTLLPFTRSDDFLLGWCSDDWFQSTLLAFTRSDDTGRSGRLAGQVSTHAPRVHEERH